MIRFTAICLLLISSTLSALAQTGDAKYYCVTLVNDVRHCGFLINDDGREVTLQTQETGTIILPKADIRLMQQTDEKYKSGALDDVADRVYDPSRAAQATRYFFGPSAITLRKGEGYGHLSWAMANVTYSATDRLMGGLSLGFGGFGFSVKHGFKLDDKIWASLGALQTFSWEDGMAQTTLPFLNATYGDEQTHVTLGGGAVASRGNETAAMAYAAASVQLSSQAWFMTENYLGASPFWADEGDTGMVMIGIRRYKERKNRLTDYGFLLRYKNEGMDPIPWLGFTWPF